MEKEEKKRTSHNSGYHSQEDTSREVFEFVNDFFTSEVKSDFVKETSIKKRNQKKEKVSLKIAIKVQHFFFLIILPMRINIIHNVKQISLSIGGSLFLLYH